MNEQGIGFKGSIFIASTNAKWKLYINYWTCAAYCYEVARINNLILTHSRLCKDSLIYCHIYEYTTWNSVVSAKKNQIWNVDGITRFELSSISKNAFLECRLSVCMHVCIVTSILIARQRLGKHIPEQWINRHQLKKLPLLCNGAVHTPSEQ
jgi:hypothetical protein